VTLWDDAKVLVEKRSSNEPWLGLHLNFYRVVIMTMSSGVAPLGFVCSSAAAFAARAKRCLKRC
jgi:hypothetical protein